MAISTRGASGCVLKTPTGLPDWISSDSSSSSSRSAARIASKHSQLRAARPMPPYTTSSFGFSATSGSRLFWIIRSAASVSQLFAVRVGAARRANHAVGVARAAARVRELIGIVTMHGESPCARLDIDRDAASERASEIAALDARAHRFEVRRERAVAIPERDVGADQRQRVARASARSRAARRRSTPCAAASSSIATMRAVFAAIGSQPARRERRHADVILLVRRGRQRVDRSRMRERLVLRRERRRGHLRDHEAGIHAAVLDQKRRQARQVRVHHQRGAALRQRADLGDREREVVRGERDGLGVEIAAGQDLARCRRTRADCPRPRSLRSAGRPPRGASGRGTRPSPAAGSAGCTGPARAGNPCASRGSRCRRADRGRSAAASICPRWPRTAWMRASNGVSLPRHASTDSAPATNAAAIARSAANNPASASAVDTCVPLSSASPSFGPEHRPAASPRCASASRAGIDATVELRLAFADQHGRQMRERREIAGRADRSLRRNARHDARVAERDERLDHAPAHARVAARERRGLERDDEAHDGVVEQRPGAGGMRQHERALQLREPRVVDARSREETESGVDAVDRLARTRRRARPCRAARIDRGFRRGIDGERHGLRPQAPRSSASVERAGAKLRTGMHRTSGRRRSALCRRSRAARATRGRRRCRGAAL